MAALAAIHGTGIVASSGSSKILIAPRTVKCGSAIARYSWNIRVGDGSTPPDIGADLAVISLGAGREDSCIVAWVDTVANPDAVELARKARRRGIVRAPCKADRQPERLGKLSPKRGA